MPARTLFMPEVCRSPCLTWSGMFSKRLYFYENGSRSRKVLTGYLREDYRGAIQSDGLGNYKIIEKEAYPDAIRLSCFQHCKRKFMNMAGNAFTSMNTAFPRTGQPARYWTIGINMLPLSSKN